MAPLFDRMSRAAFWPPYLCLLFVATPAIALFTGGRAATDPLLFAPWLWLASRRLHDINANWWWAFAPMAAGFVEGFVRGWTQAAGKQGDVNAVVQTVQNPMPQIDWALASQHAWDFTQGFFVGFGRGIAAQIAEGPLSFATGVALSLILIFWPGTPGANRFGEPPLKRGRSPAHNAALHTNTANQSDDEDAPA